MTMRVDDDKDLFIWLRSLVRLQAGIPLRALAVVVVLADVWPLTTTGVVLVLGTGVYTLVMAELQYQGVRRIAKG